MKIIIIILTIITLAAPVLAGNYRATVTKIIDGDTLIIDDGIKQRKVHLAFIDCPETSQPFGRKAADFSRIKVLNKDVGIITKGRKFGGEKLAEIVLLGSGKSLNYLLIKNGLAWPDNEWSTVLATNLHNKARAQKTGLWSQASPVAPWQLRGNDRNSILNFAHVLSRRPDAATQTSTSTSSVGATKSNPLYITASDYDINISARQAGDYVEFSGRIQNGPQCDNLRVSAYARSDEGRSANTVKVVSFTAGVKSRTFDGKVRRALRDKSKGNPQWAVDRVYVSCGN